jgi:hypothetical protein
MARALRDSLPALTAAPIAAVPEHRQDPWAAAAGWLIATYAIVVLVAASLHAGGNWVRTPPTIAVPPSLIELARGKGQRTADGIVVEATDPGGLAVLLSRTTSFAADAYPRVAWDIRTADPGEAARALTLSLVWATREQPGRTFSAPIPWPDEGPAVAKVRGHEGWRGTIAGVALAVRGTLPHPLLVKAVTVPGVSVPAEIGAIFRQWATFYPLRGISFTLPFDEERSQTLSLPAATALALGGAALGYALAARRRQRRPDARVLWALAVAGWMILDLRWQANLGWQLAQTARQYAGATIEQKYQASGEHDLYALVRSVNEVLPPAPMRVHLLTDDFALRMRASWFFYPRNVYHDLAPGKARMPTPEQLRAGDHVVSLLDTTLAYDRASGMIVWPDGRRKAVDEVLHRSPGPVVLRVR